MLFRKTSEISICIPVYNSENSLLNCLESVKNQQVPEGFSAKQFFEVIVVNDGSNGNSKNGETAKQIVKKFSKTVSFVVKYIEHSENKGLLEARRTAIYEAAGKYIFILDSDDSLPSASLSILYKKAIESDADIVQGKADIQFTQENQQTQAPGQVPNQVPEKVHLEKNRLEEIRNQIKEKINNVSEEVLTEKEIFQNYFLKQNHCGFLWGKLYKRELYLEALNHIPPAYCTFGEDFLQYFWITYEAKKYVSVDSVIYNYNLDSGISSGTVISDLSRWEKVCSTASVFTSIYSELEEKQISLSEEEKNTLGLNCNRYLANNLRQWEKAVAPEIKQEAYEMLCDYWGDDFVQQIQALLVAEQK